MNHVDAITRSGANERTIRSPFRAFFPVFSLLVLLIPAVHSADDQPKTYAVALPAGYAYERTGTIDSERGRFVSQATGSIISADIGKMAGLTITDSQDKEHLSDVLLIKISGKVFPQTVTASVIKARLTNCGHFDMTARSEQDIQDFMQLVTSFRFKGE